MLKPTERPPASLQPRFAASITPGPPPVTTAKPRLGEELRGLARRDRAAVLADPRRAEDRDGGPVDPRTFWKPPWNSYAIIATSLVEIVVRSLEDPVLSASTRVPLDVGRAHRQDEERREADVDDAVPRCAGA